MSNILFAWEFGENWGHLSRDLPVARQLRAAGHQVFCAVYDTRVASEVLEAAAIPFVQAPMSRRIAHTARPVQSYAEMLIVGGYGEHDTLRGLIGGWLGLFDLFKPDVVVIDYAPTASLAARIGCIPAVLTGSGFELPPPSSPLPAFNMREAAPKASLLLAEEVALRNINHVLAYTQTRPLARFADVFDGEHKILTTFPELDHYGERSGQVYAGPVYEMPRAQSAQWSDAGTRPRIFAYLRAWIPAVEELLRALQASGTNVICVFPGVSAAQIQRFQASGMQIFAKAVAVEPLITSADLVIGYGSGTVAMALLAGVPLLLIPRWTEQYLTALRVEALGAGLFIKARPTRDSYAASIEMLLSEPGFRTAARRFAKKYADFTGDKAVNCVVDAIQSVLLQPDRRVAEWQTIRSMLS